jgi:hypothetical protein
MSRESEDGHRYSHGRRGVQSSIVTGAIFTVVFGVVWAMNPGSWFWVFPLVFAGVLPLVNGLQRLGGERRQEPKRVADRTLSQEKQVLQAARDEGGIVTPTIVALKTDLSIQEAEKVLEGMAQKGYAAMHVTESGRLEYEFPEFLPRVDEHSGGTG